MATLSNSVEFPTILEIVQNIEGKNQWLLADELLDKCGPPSKDEDRGESNARIERVSNMLVEFGYESYSTFTLTCLRDLAFKFPPDRRYPNIGWSIHNEVGTANLMDKYIAPTKTGEIKLTFRAAREYVQRMEDLNRPKWEAKWNAEHEAKLSDLQADVDAAEEALSNATNDIEEATTKKRLTQARSAYKDQANKKTPTYIPRDELTDVPTTPSALREMVNVSSVLGDIMSANTILKKALKTLTESADSFDELYANNVSNQILEVQKTAAEALSLVRSKVTNNKRGIKIVK